ncbi:LysE family transporter [Acinetobacter seifertii]|nr:LysE family transporter [Acinetobacter seifertii]
MGALGILLVILFDALYRTGCCFIIKSISLGFIILKLVGALYLSYLGFKLLQGSIQRWKLRNQPQPEMADLPTLDKIHPYKTALSISLLNPKAILFSYLSLFSLLIQITLIQL